MYIFLFKFTITNVYDICIEYVLVIRVYKFIYYKFIIINYILICCFIEKFCLSL